MGKLCPHPPPPLPLHPKYCRMRLLYIIYYFWNNTFDRMLQGTGIAVFACDNFHSINTSIFFSQRKSQIKDPICDRRESFDIFVSPTFRS